MAAPMGLSPSDRRPRQNAAQHRKAQQRSAVGFLKLCQKLRAFSLVHGAFLTEGRLVRVAGGEILPHLL